jgi:hypothetical protein
VRVHTPQRRRHCLAAVHGDRSRQRGSEVRRNVCCGGGVGRSGGGAALCLGTLVGTIAVAGLIPGGPRDARSSCIEAIRGTGPITKAKACSPTKGPSRSSPAMAEPPSPA